MSTKVITQSTCDRCHCVNERDGAEGGWPPPIGWAVVSVNWRGGRAGWSRPSSKVLCPPCADLVLAAIKGGGA
ncbi:MAG: hypothetical protein ACYDC2_11790 [Solirubrobacteraceae bacterium]